MKTLILTALMSIASLFAADQTVKLPTIPVEDSAEFWAALARYREAEVAVKEAAIIVKQAEIKLAKDCTDSFYWNVGAAGKPTCDPKPKSEKPVTK